ncbi:hypothetical protein MP228_004486 [Amoeboaphelidium protococcarum]|nr:hypothetical protein MP228_004486 [Amoeboaphelidium protococcarum]
MKNTQMDISREIVETIVKRFIRAYLLYSVAWLGGLFAHLIFTWIPNRIRNGPQRPSWTLLHELLIVSMQYSYKWHLQHATDVPLDYQYAAQHHSLVDMQSDADKDVKSAVIEKCGVSERDLYALCCVRYFRLLISWIPLLPYYPFARFESQTISSKTGDFRVDFVTHRSITNPQSYIVYVHGGAFTFSIEASWRHMVMEISRLTNSTVVIPHYHLAPEATFPQAIDDVISTFQYLYAQIEDKGGCIQNIILMGDSAGGGLCVSSCLEMKRTGVTLPAALYLQSPWLDLTCEIANIGLLAHSELEEYLQLARDGLLMKDDLIKFPNGWARHDGQDILHLPQWPFDLSECYVSGLQQNNNGPRSLNQIPKTNSKASPFFASIDSLYESLPPTLIQVGQKEYLCDESMVMATRLARKHGERMRGGFNSEWLQFYHSQNKELQVTRGPIQVQVYEHMTHVFQLFAFAGVKEGADAISAGCKFIKLYSR